jgi:basic membrane protein A
MIIAANPLYEAVCKKLSAEFHYVIFAVSGGSSFNDTNLTSYAGRIYEALYLCGIAAGLKTVNEKIGFVSAKHFYKDEVYSDADAFAMGVESVNPHARVYVQITGDGADAAAESANYLFSLGCDVVGQDCDTPSPQIAAQNAGRFGTGFNRDMIADAPDAVLTCAIWHWEDFYKKLLQSVIDGTFTTTPYYGGLAEGIVDITPLSKNVQRGTEEIINSEKRRIKDKSFRIFEGFLLTNDGNVTGSIADALNDDEIRAIDWYYHNIVQTDY